MANEKSSSQLTLEFQDQAPEPAPKQSEVAPKPPAAPVVSISDRQADKQRSEEAKYVTGLLSLVKHLK